MQFQDTFPVDVFSAVRTVKRNSQERIFPCLDSTRVYCTYVDVKRGQIDDVDNDL